MGNDVKAIAEAEALGESDEEESGEPGTKGVPASAAASPPPPESLS